MNSPIPRLTTKTSTVRLRVWASVGQVTFLSSDQASSMLRRRDAPRRRMRSTIGRSFPCDAVRIGGGRGDRTRTYNRRFWRPVLCQLSYTPALTSLLRLPMKRMATLMGTVLHQLDPVRIVLLVLARRVRPALALRAGELDDGARLDPCHRVTRR